MLFIPLLWNMHTHEAAKEKWAFVKRNRHQVGVAVLAGFIGILPQLIYWKAVTGSFVYDVGSKWAFLNPWFRVLLGWEKGWFIYTPVTIFFIAGMFFMKGQPFRKSVLTFCLLNIWIIIAWDDWQYGGSYSTRALVQSYPVFALPLAAFIQKINTARWKYLFYAAGLYLIGVNLFQIVQYNQTILHYRDMNRRYYSRIYLNPDPSPLDMSLLDTDEFLGKEAAYNKQIVLKKDTTIVIKFSANEAVTFLKIPPDTIVQAKGDSWYKIEATIPSATLWESSLHAALQRGDSVKATKQRMYTPVAERTHHYAFYVRVPPYFSKYGLKLSISSPHNFEGMVQHLTITRFY
jgi:hypothetical protein